MLRGPKFIRFLRDRFVVIYLVWNSHIGISFEGQSFKVDPLNVQIYCMHLGHLQSQISKPKRAKISPEAAVLMRTQPNVISGYGGAGSALGA
jgi:hypothetical protein